MTTPLGSRLAAALMLAGYPLGLRHAKESPCPKSYKTIR